MLNWDPGNAAALDGTTFSAGYSLLPKDRIGHCHCKDVVRKPDHGYDWAPVGAGIVDWPGQLRALKQDGFHYGLSLETHWRGAGTPEASTRVSMFIAKLVGYILQRSGSYQIPFLIAGCSYLVALGAIHLLTPRLTPAQFPADDGLK